MMDMDGYANITLFLFVIVLCLGLKQYNLHIIGKYNFVRNALFCNKYVMLNQDYSLNSYLRFEN